MAADFLMRRVKRHEPPGGLGLARPSGVVAPQLQ
ncbi:MAG: hypothetical protein K0Q55_1740, partial [Verrucomicrobia bacterium]|nr:hypothetical protein [Verrucomicrobiota bacterium]